MSSSTHVVPSGILTPSYLTNLLTLSGWSAETIQSLSLTSLSLKTLTYSSSLSGFPPLPSLIILNLRRNNLENLNGLNLEQLPSLECLYVSHNSLNQIPSLKGFNLKELDLRFNPCSLKPGYRGAATQNFSTLKILDLRVVKRRKIVEDEDDVIELLKDEGEVGDENFNRAQNSEPSKTSNHVRKKKERVYSSSESEEESETEENIILKCLTKIEKDVKENSDVMRAFDSEIVKKFDLETFTNAFKEDLKIVESAVVNGFASKIVTADMSVGCDLYSRDYEGELMGFKSHFEEELREKNEVIKDLTVVIKSLTESVEGKEKKVMHCLGANATS